MRCRKALSSIVLLIAVLFTANEIHACQETLRSYGAIGDGLVDDTVAIQNAFQSVCDLDGGNLTYAVAGSLEIRNDITLTNAKFLQKGFAVNIRTLKKSSGSITLKRVVVHRGQNERNGSIGDSAGIFLQDVSDSLLEDVEVTGNGYGAGIWIEGSNRVTLLRPYVHDMRWSTVAPPQFEQLLGIWINQSNDVNILYGRVINLLGETGDGVYRSWQSDGITLSRTSHAFILSTAVENTGEGFDVTGTYGNEHFEIAHSSAIDSDSFGFKVANSGRHGLIRDSVAIRAGYAGFVVSGPSEAGLEIKSSEITIERSQAVNTGYNRRWSQYNVSGFLILQGLHDDDNKDFPQKVRIVDSQSIDNERHTTKFGFYSQVEGKSGVYNTDSVGHSVEGNRGLPAAQYGFGFIQQQAMNIMGCALKPRYLYYYFDQSYLAGWTPSRLIADLEDAKRRGLFELCQ